MQTHTLVQATAGTTDVAELEAHEQVKADPFTRRLHYRGLVDSPPVGSAMGPTTYGQTLYVVGAEYDPVGDRTAVFVSPIRPAATS